MKSLVDLDRYRARIGYTGALNSDFECLAALCAHHVASIPFENCSVLLGHPVNLDLESLQRKLIDENRGGYCFEQNGLMLEVLKAIGFDARPLSARVRIGQERDFTPARTHMINVVRLDGAEWIVDCGVGALSPSAPVRWELNTRQESPHEPRRIVHEEGKFFHQFERDGAWADIYEFTGEEMPLVDREVGNWWTSTCPRSKFKQGHFCALANAPGERKTLLNRQFNHRRGSETIRTVELNGGADSLELLRSEFGLSFPPETIFPTF